MLFARKETFSTNRKIDDINSLLKWKYTKKRLARKTEEKKKNLQRRFVPFSMKMNTLLKRRKKIQLNEIIAMLVCLQIT